MAELPDPLPEVGNWAKLFGWLNQLRAFCASLRPLQSVNTLTAFTEFGVFRQGNQAGKKGGAGDTQYKGAWDGEDDYVVGDSVDCYTTSDINDGRKAGYYFCIEDIPGDAGNDHPSADSTHWRQAAHGHFGKFRFRNGDRVVEIDLTGTYKFKVYDYADSGLGSVTIDLADIPLDAGNLELKIREISGKDTESGNCYKMLVIGSDWYE